MMCIARLEAARRCGKRGAAALAITSGGQAADGSRIAARGQDGPQRGGRAGHAPAEPLPRARRDPGGRGVSVGCFLGRRISSTHRALLRLRRGCQSPRACDTNSRSERARRCLARGRHSSTSPRAPRLSATGRAGLRRVRLRLLRRIDAHRVTAIRRREHDGPRDFARSVGGSSLLVSGLNCQKREIRPHVARERFELSEVVPGRGRDRERDAGLGGIESLRVRVACVVERARRLQLPSVIGAVDELLAIPLQRMDRARQP
jgi:hypothetical protein